MKLAELLPHVDHENFSPSNRREEGEVRFALSIHDALENRFALRWTNVKSMDRMRRVQSGTIIVPLNTQGPFHPDVDIIECEDPKWSFIQAINTLFPDGVVCDIACGDRVKTHATSVIGKEGFGFHKGVRFPHIGHVQLHDDVEIGAHSCVDRGAIGSTVIWHRTKIDNLVHIAHNVRIGSDCQVVAGAVIGGSAVIGDRVFIGMGALIKNKVRIGNDAIIGMGAVVTKDVPAGETWVGNPARKLEK